MYPGGSKQNHSLGLKVAVLTAPVSEVLNYGGQLGWEQVYVHSLVLQ